MFLLLKFFKLLILILFGLLLLFSFMVFFCIICIEYEFMILWVSIIMCCDGWFLIMYGLFFWNLIWMVIMFFFWMRVVIGGSLVWLNFCFVVVCDMYCLSDVWIVLYVIEMLGLCDIWMWVGFVCGFE